MLLFHSTVKRKVQVNHPLYYKNGFNKSYDLVGDITQSVWSPCIYKEGHRLEANFLRSYWCVLDYDEGMTLADALSTWCDCRHIIGTTKSHQVDKKGVTADRFRVCIPWQTPITDLNTFRYNMAYMTDRYEADPQCKDGARFYFPCSEIVSRETDGYCVDVRPAPEPVEVEKVEIDHSKVIPRFVMGWLKYGCPEGQRNKTCYQIGAELGKVGYTIDEIFSLVMSSPVPLISPGRDVSIEVRKSITNGVNKYNGQ